MASSQSALAPSCAKPEQRRLFALQLDKSLFPDPWQLPCGWSHRRYRLSLCGTAMLAASCLCTCAREQGVCTADMQCASNQLNSSDEHAVQARDDSIANFQAAQQQAPSAKHQQRLDHMASQLQDTQAQLFATQVFFLSASDQQYTHTCCDIIQV